MARRLAPRCFRRNRQTGWLTSKRLGESVKPQRHRAEGQKHNTTKRRYDGTRKRRGNGSKTRRHDTKTRCKLHDTWKGYRTAQKQQQQRGWRPQGRVQGPPMAVTVDIGRHFFGCDEDATVLKLSALLENEEDGRVQVTAVTRIATSNLRSPSHPCNHHHFWNAKEVEDPKGAACPKPQTLQMGTLLLRTREKHRTCTGLSVCGRSDAHEPPIWGNHAAG